jgi:hypothetical protein
LGANKLEKDEIEFTFYELKAIMIKMRYYDKMSDPIALYDWSEIGLERILYKYNYMWQFKIVDKKKFIHNMIKYNFFL